MVSVLIPTYNRWELLCNRALPSVLAQSYQNFEIILAGHGEETWIKAPVEMAKNPKVKLLYVPRHLHYPDTPRNRWLTGPVDPLNAALKIARGDLLARIDDDDIWMATHLEQSIRFMQTTGCEFVSSKYRIDHSKGECSFVMDDGGWPPIGGTQTWVWRSYLKCMKWNRDCWRKEWNAVNDTDLAQRMRNAGVQIGHCGLLGAVIRPRPGTDKVGLAAYLE